MVKLLNGLFSPHAYPFWGSNLCGNSALIYSNFCTKEVINLPRIKWNWVKFALVCVIVYFWRMFNVFDEQQKQFGLRMWLPVFFRRGNWREILKNTDVLTSFSTFSTFRGNLIPKNPHLNSRFFLGKKSL